MWSTIRWWVVILWIEIGSLLEFYKYTNSLVLGKRFWGMGFLLKSCVSEFRVKRIRVNQGLGVLIKVLAQKNHHWILMCFVYFWNGTEFGKKLELMHYIPILWIEKLHKCLYSNVNTDQQTIEINQFYFLPHSILQFFDQETRSFFALFKINTDYLQ